MKIMHFFTVAALALAACGDDKGAPDAPKSIDSPPADAINIPPPPTPGAQIDRMGRPAVNTALNHTFDVNATAKGSAKDAYNQDGGAGTWSTTYLNEFAKNLAVLDALDTTTTQTGCGNQVCYNGQSGGCPGGGGSAMTCPGANCSYNFLAGVLADDQLYVDTSKTECKFYLAVEFGVVTGLGHSTCGGRGIDYDVIDFSYTALAIGASGFSNDGNFTPAFGDGVGPHTDTTPTFPFLGPPHNQ